MKKKPNDSMKSKYIFVILCVVCCGLIFLTFTSDMASGPLKYAAGLITPIQKGMNEVGNWIADKGDYFQDSVNLAAQNRELQEKVDALTAENSQLLQDQEELERLRDLLELDHQYSDYEKVGARITARDTGNWFNVFTIDKGTDDGVQVDCNVIANGGLVGIVIDAGPNWATVRSIIDDNSNVSAMVSKTSDTCIIAGDLRLIDEGKINLVKLTDAADRVTEGDKVVTSDISDRYLPGILIGYISEISMDSNNLTKSGYITPVVDFRHLREVLVIKERKNRDGAEALNRQEESETDMLIQTEGLPEEQTEESTQADGETAALEE
ncbi:MAG: rod shape-determining protein MreC [Candidatus Limivivens sp.]|nr:rod shape-determining protein MreC [Candidatus Limivivens sp.]